jgi:hypothetical protein
MEGLEQIALTVPEVRRLWHAQHEPEERCVLHLHWSHFRRAHQAAAKHCHVARHSHQLPQSQPSVDEFLLLRGLEELSEERWEQIYLILPPQRPPTGRPSVDHRQIVEGILWIIRTGSSWRELPARFGPWSTVASRYFRWCLAGIWARILQILQSPSAPPLISTG